MLDFQNILLAITAFVNAGVVIFIYSARRASPTNRYFALFSLFLSFWAIAILYYEIVADPTTTLYALKTSYVAALFIVVTFYFFSLSFPQERRAGLIHTLFILVPSVLFCALVFTPGFLIAKLVLQSGGNAITLVPLHFYIFAFLFVSLIVSGLGRIWAKYFFGRLEKGKRVQLFAIGFSATIAGILGMYFNLILASPVFNDFRYLWTGPLFTFFISSTIIYTIFRYGLFQAKAIISELFIFLLWVFTFIRMLLSETTFDQVINGVLFILTVLLGILLIRSVRAENLAKERIEGLAKDLEKANTRLKELDKQKTEFVSIASHQLRSPLTAIKGYASLLIEGSYGKLSAGVLDATQKIYDSSKYMAVSIEDFLNVSRIELGTMKYDKKELDLAALVKTTVEELAPAAHEKGLKLSYHAGEDKYLALGDIGKLKQVIANLIDNAMKYTPKGSIDVSVAKSQGKVRLEIKDTGVGISAETLPKLFEKFVRAKNANNVNVSGTGLGLFVAKEFVTAHGGRVWAQSEGEGHGSTFIVELPTAS